MSHAITIGDLLWWALIGGGIVVVLAVVYWVVFVLMNPFSSGH